jgi:drug/metabolite transporter (DMT)-like permease
MFFGWLFLGEHLSASMLVGAGLILGGNLLGILCTRGTERA